VPNNLRGRFTATAEYDAKPFRTAAEPIPFVVR